jgi:glycosyltransferase involved in cell wall biosynthesis
VKPGDTWGAARALHQIFSDPQSTWRLRDTARSESFSFFSRLRFCDQVRKVYEQIAEGYPVVVDDLPVTGGVRFGR